MLVWASMISTEYVEAWNTFLSTLPLFLTSSLDLPEIQSEAFSDICDICEG